MKKTVLITGASSGIGKHTALFFQKKGWKVIATMRNPNKSSTDLKAEKNMDLVHLDVTDPISISKAINYTIDRYGAIDVLINNAGYALYGPFEYATNEQILRQYATNVFGLMEVIRQVLPIMKKRRYGKIINVSSLVGKVGMPGYALYGSTKWAIEGFTESLKFELSDYNIQLKLIEPGMVATDFYGRSQDVIKTQNEEVYRSYIQRLDSNLKSLNILSSKPETVAKHIYKVAVSNSGKFRYVIGYDAKLFSWLRKMLSDHVFHYITKIVLLKGKGSEDYK